VRLARDPDYLLAWPNMVDQRIEEDDASCSKVHDPVLGWRPRSNVSRPEYKTGADGFRQTPRIRGALPLREAPPILVTGSSFAEGTEVDDDETIPAFLQAKLGQKVLNGGVAGYALDQIVLSSERFVAMARPARLVVSFTPFDIENLELSRLSWAEKPFFVLDEAGELELRNVPTPHLRGACTPSVGNRLLGWSMLAEMAVASLSFVADLHGYEQRVMDEGEGDKLVCPLMARLGRLGVPVLVVAQVNREIWEDDRLREAGRAKLDLALRCAREAGLDTLNLFPVLEAAVENHGLDAWYLEDHHSPEGNRLAAGEIASALERTHLPARFD
jgi:hypothetical protein